MPTNAALVAPFPPDSIGFWRGYWLTVRPYLFAVSGASGLVGLALAPELSLTDYIVAFTAFFFAYGLGQAVTDVFQTDTDALSSPFRPLVRGEIARRDVLIVSLIGLALCASALVALNRANLGLSVVAVAGLFTYTWFKRRWWGGPFWNAWIVALFPVMGFVSGGASLGEALKSGRLAAVVVSVFFSYAVFVLLGYFKDISADKATGYRTLPVVAGWRMSIAVSAAFAFAAIIAGAWILVGYPDQPGFGSAGGITLWIAGALMLVRAHVVMRGLDDELLAHRAIVPAVRGHVLIHLGLAAAIQSSLLFPALAVYLLFEGSLAARPEQTQV